jgi:recombination protein RecR
MKIPKAIQNVIDSFERLPGIGPKSAQRLTFHLLHFPQENIEQFAQNLIDLKKSIKTCSICFNIGETEVCSICSDPTRDASTICVVEDVLDVLAMERSGRYKGRYHVLQGLIDPLNSIGPDDIYIPQLLERVRNQEIGISEVILATNPTMEGEATAMYLTKQLRVQSSELRITRIGYGLPTGADLEYADEITLARAMEGRREY